MPSSLNLKVIEKVDEFAAWRKALALQGDKPLLGFVPTMGALHEGHATLIRLARARCQKVVVSIFVNPMQFGPNEDYSKYPRTFEADKELCLKEGVDAIFFPLVDEVYGKPISEVTKVMPPSWLIERLCGLFRPGHFEGVATVVMKLFGIVQPTQAFFGEKDYQQLTVVRHMVADLNFPTEIVAVPTVRESDGLALSSRNVYLTRQQRALAPNLYKVIDSVLKDSLAGKQPLRVLLEQGRQKIAGLEGVSLQYLEACHAETLMPLEEAQEPMVVLVAAKFAEVRLIDNVVAGKRN